MSDVLAQLQRPFQDEINFQDIFAVDEIKRGSLHFRKRAGKQGKRCFGRKNSNEHRSKVEEESGELFHGGGGSVFDISFRKQR